MTQKTNNNSWSHKKKYLASSAVVALGLFTSAPAFAHPEEDELPGEFTGNIAIATDYVYRGVTQTDGGPAVSGGFDYAVDLFYVGVWASNVEWDGTSVEIDYYGGFTPSYGQFAFDVGFLYYSYPDSPDGPEQDFFEFYAGASTEIVDGLEAGVKLSFSPDFYGETGEAYYPELNVSYSFMDNYSVSGHVGYQAFDDDMMGDDYTDWNIAFTYSWDWFDVSLGYFDTSDRVGGDDDGRVVLSLSRSF